jgi:hypothetical protein
MFEVGQKVVCVNDQPLNTAHYWDGRLEQGKIYVVRAIGQRHPHYPGVDCVKVEGIVRRPNDHPYAAQRFQPLPERKTSIEIFQKILRDVTEKVT